MPNRTIPKKVKMGYALRIFSTQREEWERVGFCFTSRREAEEFRVKHHPSATKFTITGIKLSAEKLLMPEHKSLEGERA